MKHLSKVVNIIPVIAKADTMTLEEKTEFKQRVSIVSPLLDEILPCPGLEVGEMSGILLPGIAVQLYTPRVCTESNDGLVG